MKPDRYTYLGCTIMLACGVWIVSNIAGRVFLSAEAAEKAIEARTDNQTGK